MKTVVVLGASPKPDRYAFKAMQRLQKHGYKAIPVNPAFKEVLGEGCYASIADVPQPIDTVLLYLGAVRSTPLIQDIIKAKPRRIIFNPGAENEKLEKAASSVGIETVNGCTLVMLGLGRFSFHDFTFDRKWHSVPPSETGHKNGEATRATADIRLIV